MFNQYRKRYPEFIFDNYEVKDNDEYLELIYHFNIPNLTSFNPCIKINKKDITNKNIDHNFINLLAFNIGLVELISYWKCTCSPNVTIKCGYLDEYQINWFKKLYFNGLGEFFYTNNIETNINTFMNITSTGISKKTNISYEGIDNLILVGGGKDSVVSLELLKEMNNSVMIVNPKEIMIECAETANIEDICEIKRTIDKELLRLNNEKFLNGHTPFSSLLAFLSYLIAYLKNKKYIILSNESSANEGNVIGLKVNHQYSKSYEFEQDFNNYTKKYFNIEIKYFSLLRPLNELQIAYLFSKCKKYHSIFRSCNVGSKTLPWEWCCNCSKCLFVYIMLSVFLKEEEMIEIFKENLLDKESLLETFKELIGDSTNKPFDCVGTFEEVNYAIKTIINQNKNYKLLDYYKKNHDVTITENLLDRFNNEHNLEKKYLKIVKDALNER